MKRAFVAMAVMLITSAAQAGSLWISGQGSYAAYGMKDLDASIRDYNDSYGTDLSSIGSGVGACIAVGRDLYDMSGAIGLAFEYLDGSCSLAHGDYNIDIRVPAYAVRLFLKGYTPWLKTDSFSTSVGGSIGVISSSAEYSQRYYHEEEGSDPIEELVSGDFGSSGMLFDWFLGANKQVGSRLSLDMDLGYRVNTMNDTTIDGRTFGAEYNGFFLRCGVQYRITL